jgi:hypothetical protein
MARSQFARETDRDSEEDIRSGQAQADDRQDYRHLLAVLTPFPSPRVGNRPGPDSRYQSE